MISIVTIQQVSLVTYRMLVLQLSITLSGCRNDQPDCRRCFLQPHSGIEHLNCVTMLFMWSIIVFLDRVNLCVIKMSPACPEWKRARFALPIRFLTVSKVSFSSFLHSGTRVQLNYFSQLEDGRSPGNFQQPQTCSWYDDDDFSKLCSLCTGN